MKKEFKYIKCDICCFDLLDEDGDLLDHECEEEIEEVSNCCSAKVIGETDICSKCKEHCDSIKI